MIVVVLILVGWVVYVSSKQIERNRRIQEEITSLEEEAAKIHNENETLSEKISYFASDDFREQEAKKKLGLKKAGETVVEVKTSRSDSAGLASGDNSTVQEESWVASVSSVDGAMENYKKWWKAFFGMY